MSVAEGDNTNNDNNDNNINNVNQQVVITIILTVLSSVATVTLFNIFGIIFTSKRFHVLSKQFLKDSAKFCTQICTPCLLFSRVGESVTIDDIRNSSILFLWSIVNISISCLVGACTILLAKPPVEFRREYSIASTFGNAFALPLILSETLCNQLNLGYDNDMKEQVAKSSSYIFMYSLSFQLFLWIFGYSYLAKEYEINLSVFKGKRLSCFKGISREDGLEEDNLNTDNNNIVNNNNINNNNNDNDNDDDNRDDNRDRNRDNNDIDNRDNNDTNNNVILNTTNFTRDDSQLNLNNTDYSSTAIVPNTNNNSGTENDNIFVLGLEDEILSYDRKNTTNHSRTSSDNNNNNRNRRDSDTSIACDLFEIDVLEQELNSKKKKTIKDILSFTFKQPPVFCLLLAVVIGCIPSLRDLFFARKAPLIFFTNMTMITGNIAVGIVTIAMAGSLGQSFWAIYEKNQQIKAKTYIPNKEENLFLSKRTIITLVISRMVITPFFQIIALLACESFMIENKLIRLVLVLETCVPSANLVVVMSQDLGNRKQAEALAGCYLYMYLIGLMTLTGYLSFGIAVFVF